MYVCVCECVYVCVCMCVCVCVCVSVRVYMCLCSLGTPARNSHAPYSHLWPAQLYHIFPHYLITARFTKKKVIERKMCVGCLYHSYRQRVSLQAQLSRTLSHRNVPLFF